MWLVVHANHAREFTDAARAALRRVLARGVPLLGQSVLLRGVNDSAAALEALFRAMLGARVKPYYLHQLDAAPGTARFHVPIEEGRALLAALRGRVTGLAWPTYVLDIPGGFGKVPIGPEYLRADGTVRDARGRVGRSVRRRGRGLGAERGLGQPSVRQRWRTAHCQTIKSSFLRAIAAAANTRSESVFASNTGADCDDAHVR